MVMPLDAGVGVLGCNNFSTYLPMISVSRLTVSPSLRSLNTVTATVCGIADIEKAKEPLFSTKVDEERAGLGFTIMEVFTDKLDVKSRLNDGTRVNMIKQYNES